MGNMRGHVVYGTGFSLIGLWHLINHSKRYTLNPNSFTSLPWFPTSRIKLLEPYFIMAASAAAVSMGLFFGLRNHRLLDADGTIPSTHLHNLEHSAIALAIFAYAFCAALMEALSIPPPAKRGLTNAAGAAAFAVELLVFHVHSADRMGVEGQYHRLLQAVISTTFAATVLMRERSFLIAYVRSMSLLFQGVWLVNIGFMLWTPSLIFKGCFMHWEKGFFVVRCEGEEALQRAKSLVNIQFGLFFVWVNVLGVLIYLIIFKIYSKNINAAAARKEMVEIMEMEMEM